MTVLNAVSVYPYSGLCTIRLIVMVTDVKINSHTNIHEYNNTRRCWHTCNKISIGAYIKREEAVHYPKWHCLSQFDFHK